MRTRLLAAVAAVLALAGCTTDPEPTATPPAAAPTTASPTPLPARSPTPEPSPTPTVWEKDPNGAALCIAVKPFWTTQGDLPAPALAAAGKTGMKSTNGLLRILGEDLASYAEDEGSPPSAGFRRKVDQIAQECLRQGYYTVG